MTGTSMPVVPAAGPSEGMYSIIWLPADTELNLDSMQGFSISYQSIHKIGPGTCMSLRQLEAHTKGTRQSIKTAGEATRSDGVCLCTGDDRICGIGTQLAAHLIPVTQEIQCVLVCIRWEGNDDMGLHQQMKYSCDLHRLACPDSSSRGK